MRDNVISYDCGSCANFGCWHNDICGECVACDYANYEPMEADYILWCYEYNIEERHIRVHCKERREDTDYSCGVVKPRDSRIYQMYATENNAEVLEDFCHKVSLCLENDYTTLRRSVDRAYAMWLDFGEVWHNAVECRSCGKQQKKGGKKQ